MTNPWDGTTLFASSCACIATMKIRRGEIAQAQEIADELKLLTNVLGTRFAAQIIEDMIAAEVMRGDQIARSREEARKLERLRSFA